MPQRRVVDLVDDFDGSAGAGTVAFSFDGIAYELELSDNHADQLRDALLPFVAAARRTEGAPRPVQVVFTRLIDPKSVRAWAAHKGIPLKSRGRIPDEVLKQYEAAVY